MNEKKYIVKYNFPYCEKQTVNDKNGKPLQLSLANAKLVAKRIGAYTTIEEIK